MGPTCLHTPNITRGRPHSCGQVRKGARRRECSARAVSSAGSDPLARSSSVGFSVHFRNLYPGTEFARTDL